MAQLIGKWKLEKADGRPITVNTEVTFEEGKLSYRYGNCYSGRYKVQGQTIQFGYFVGTEMQCPQEPPEELVTFAIRGSNTWDIQGKILTLSNLSGAKVVLTRL